MCVQSAELRSTLARLQTKEGSAQDELIIEPVTELASKRLREERDNENVELEKPVLVVIATEGEENPVEDESNDVTEETVVANNERDDQRVTPVLPRRAKTKSDQRSKKLREKVIKSQPPPKTKKKLRREDNKRLRHVVVW